MSSSVHCRLWNVTHCGCVCAKSLQSCLALSDPVDCNLPGSSVHGILQAKILEWVSMPSSRGSSRPRDQTHISYFSCTGKDFPGGSDGKESACDAGDLGLIPGSGRSPGEENGYPFQYSCLENSMDRGAWQAGYSPWSHKDLDMTEKQILSLSLPLAPPGKPM